MGNEAPSPMPEIEEGVADSLKIMIVGKPGIGKSSLVNGLLGKYVAEVKSGIFTAGITRVVEPHMIEHNGITATVYDTPGLLDSTLDNKEIMSIIKRESSKVDLLLLCINNSDNRFIKEDENNTIIERLKKSLDKPVWSKTLVVLTFSNQLIDSLNLEYHSNRANVKRKFYEHIETWNDIMKKTLPPEFCGVIPTGHIKQGKLLKGDKYHWLSNFWEKCFLSLQDDGKKAALVLLNKARLTKKENIAIKGELENTEITVTDKMVGYFQDLKHKFLTTFPWLEPYL